MCPLRGPERDHGLVHELLVAVGDRRPKIGLAQADDCFSGISRLNYTSSLAKTFDRKQIQGLLADLRCSLPALNRSLFRETNLTRLASVAKELGVTLRIEKAQDVEIRGFYLNDSALSARPLIVLNAANPSVTVAAAFWHEIGHHLTHGIFGAPRDRLNLTFASTCQDNLNDPEELLADIVMTLCAYPAAIARRTFGTAGLTNNPRGLVKLVEKASAHVRSISGFQLSDAGPVKKKLKMMASMIHIAKLRIALLEGYGI